MATGFLISLVVLCCIAGLLAPILNHFRKKTASCLALTAGFSPCLFFVSQSQTTDNGFFIGFLGIFGAMPLFLCSFFAYGFGEKTNLDKIAATVSMIGIFLGTSYTLMLVDLLARGE